MGIANNVVVIAVGKKVDDMGTSASVAIIAGVSRAANVGLEYCLIIKYDFI